MRVVLVRRFVPWLVWLAATACVAAAPHRAPVLPLPAEPPSAPQDSRPPIVQPFPATNGQVGGAWIPWAALDLDERTRTPGTPGARVDDGDGFAVRGGRFDDSLGVEMVFATTRHDERSTGAELTTYAAYVDLSDRWELWRGPVFAWAGVGFGMGLIRFEWDRAYRSELTGLWQGEGILALQIGPNVSIEARAMGFLAAHPGRSAGTGLMTMLGGSIAF